jgi:hypothetical protein
MSACGILSLFLNHTKYFPGKFKLNIITADIQIVYNKHVWGFQMTSVFWTEKRFFQISQDHFTLKIFDL